MSPHCNNCGAHVTAQYVRVFGHNGAVAACLHCAHRGEVSDGGGVPEVGE